MSLHKSPAYRSKNFPILNFLSIGLGAMILFCWSCGKNHVTLRKAVFE